MFTKGGEPLSVPIVGDLPDDKNSCVFKLRGYLLAENPIHFRRDKLQNLTQQEGQKFSACWAAKLNMVKQCNMDKGLIKNNILGLELIKGVYDVKLRQELIRKSFFVFLGCFWAYFRQSHDHIG